MVKRFTRHCSPCYLEGELKTLQNTFLSLGYPGKLVFKVITRAKNSTVKNDWPHIEVESVLKTSVPRK